MFNNQTFGLYQGSGETLADRKEEMPVFSPAYSGMNDPKGYVVDPRSGLSEAVNVAIALGKPLLLTGEPGVGKTTLAKSISHELGLNLFKFYTKTTSTAKDLFYSYNMMEQYAAVHIRKEKHAPTEKFITLNALGKAILLAEENHTTKSVNLIEELKSLVDTEKLLTGLSVGKPCRCVVLIDEIDKAPRDLPNDLLHEIENMEFSIMEMEGNKIKADEKYRPIVLITSNSERNLPDAFLRRCVFYHIEFPSNETLKAIVKKRFRHNALLTAFTDDFLDAACVHLQEIRKLKLKKIPATDEFLAWLSILKTFYDQDKLFQEQEKDKMLWSYAALVKNRDDRETVEQFYKRG